MIKSLLTFSLVASAACASQDASTQSTASELSAQTTGGSILDACPLWRSGDGTCLYTGHLLKGPTTFTAVATGQIDPSSGRAIYACDITPSCDMQSMTGEDPTFDINGCAPAFWADQCPTLPARQAQFTLLYVSADSQQSATNWCSQEITTFDQSLLQDYESQACGDLEASAAGTIKCCVQSATE